MTTETPDHLPTVGLADTSCFIAAETSRPLGPIPARILVSVVTLGELELGVVAVADDAVRARRAGTLALARQAEPLPVTESVMSAWARLVADTRAAGIHRAVRLTDTLIAATAVDRGVPVVSQDQDFLRLARAHSPLQVWLV